jgi:hypothetical protein
VGLLAALSTTSIVEKKVLRLYLFRREKKKHFFVSFASNEDASQVIGVCHVTVTRVARDPHGSSVLTGTQQVWPGNIGTRRPGLPDFSGVQHTKMGENIPNHQKIQITNVHKIYRVAV